MSPLIPRQQDTARPRTRVLSPTRALALQSDLARTPRSGAPLWRHSGPASEWLQSRVVAGHAQSPPHTFRVYWPRLPVAAVIPQLPDEEESDEWEKVWELRGLEVLIRKNWCAGSWKRENMWFSECDFQMQNSSFASPILQILFPWPTESVETRYI